MTLLFKKNLEKKSSKVNTQNLLGNHTKSLKRRGAKWFSNGKSTRDF
jgi:hypothetical protein